MSKTFNKKSDKVATAKITSSAVPKLIGKRVLCRHSSFHVGKHRIGGIGLQKLKVRGKKEQEDGTAGSELVLKIRKLKESPNYEAEVAWLGPFADKNPDGVSRVHFDDVKVNELLAEKGTSRERVIDAYDQFATDFLSKMSETRLVQV